MIEKTWVGSNAQEGPHQRRCHRPCRLGVDAGRLNYKCGWIDERTTAKFEKGSRQLGKGSSKRGSLTTLRLSVSVVSRLTSQWKFETSKCYSTIIDAPGHRYFIKNVITGTSRLMLVSLLLRLSGDFEAGISKSGQTRKHILLSYTLGVNWMIVAVNKMDEKTVNCSESGTTRSRRRPATS